MYDAKTRAALVKARVRAAQRRQARRGRYGLAGMCTALLAVLVGAVDAAAGQPQAATEGTFGAMLLHEAAGGYVLVGVVSFTAAMVLTVLCIRYREKRRRESGAAETEKAREQEGEQV